VEVKAAKAETCRQAGVKVEEAGTRKQKRRPDNIGPPFTIK